MKLRNNKFSTRIVAQVVLGSLVLAPAAFAKTKVTGNSGVEEALKFKEGDEKGNELKALKTELLVINSEKKALAQLQKLHRRYENTRMEPDILLRLAELYMRRARSERFFEVHKDSQQVMVLTPQLVKEASESGEIKKAIEYYERIQAKYPSFRSMDTVLFNNSYARQQIGDDKGAEQLLLRLIRDYPRSGLVPDSYLSIGEINFQRRAYTVALENFQAIRKYPQARVYPYGLYKAAWCYYNLQDATSGIKQLEEVVKFGREVAVNKLDSKLDLRKEALGDMALFFGDVKSADQAVEYFMAQAAEIDPVPYILRLSDLYERHGRLNDVERVLTGVLNKIPKSEAIPSVHEKLVWNSDRTKNQEKAVTQLEAFDKYCDANSVVTDKKLKKGEVPPRTECQDKIADASKKLAMKWHGIWKKWGGKEGGKSNEKLSASTERAYELYLKTADVKDGELPTTRFAFAELLFARGQYREASGHYASIEGYHKPGVKIDEKISHDASYGAIVSLERATNDKWSDQDEAQFVTLSDSYVRRFPNGQFALELKFKRAFIAYEKERFDEAAPQFKKIGWMDFPAGTAVPEKVLRAQDLYMDILNHKKDYKALKEAAQSLISRSATGARVANIEKIYREAYFAEIQLMEEKGELAAAVEAYKKFALENTGSELASKAWWNASQLQFKMGDATGGANTCYQMHKLFPKSSNGRDCLTKAAQTFEAMARLDLAARVLLNLAMVETEKQDHWRMVAADFFALSGDQERAISMYMKLAEGKKTAEQVPLLDKAALVARDSGDMKTHAQLEAKFSQMGIEPYASRMVVEQAEAAFEKGDFEKAFNTSKRIIGKDSLPKDLLARARFVQARVLEDEYRRQSVKTKVERVGMVLAIKTEKLEKAQKAFQSAIKYGDPDVSVKALRKLAEMYLDYSKSLRGLTLTTQLAEADQKAFAAEIEQLTIPMEEKGIEAMGQALEAAKKSQLREGQIADLQVEMNRLNMKTSAAPTVVVSAPSVYMPEFRGPAGVTQ